jgi:hypothetical protein
MGYLIFIIIASLLLGGFFALTGYEARRGSRYFALERDRLDRNVERVEFIWQHVDLAAFVRDEIRRLAGRLSHDIAHLSLQTVRAVERLLTRLVRYLRSKHAIEVGPRENVREFVKTLSDFKDQLKTPQPEALDIR